MKIAMIGHKRIPSREGGVEIVVAQLSKRMVAKGHQVVAYNRKSEHIAGKNFDTGNNVNEWEGIKIKWVPTPNSSKLNAIVYSGLATLKACFEGYDVIHFHAEGPCSMILLAKLFRKRCVATIHGLDWQRSKWGGFATKFLQFGEKVAAKYADEVIVLSKNVQQYFKDTYNRDTVYIPNGIEEPQIVEPNIIKDKYALEKDQYILFLGRIVPEKGVHYLIDAYSKLDTDKKLVIAGGASHTSEYMDEIQNKAKDVKNVIFTGFVQGQELEELYSNAYIYCLPSDLEGMPISLLEAMSFGNCCLTSNIPECSEVCKDKALYFNKSDIKDLETQLTNLLNFPNKVKEYKSNAKDYILANYDWDKVVAETLNLYSKQ